MMLLPYHVIMLAAWWRQQCDSDGCPSWVMPNIPVPPHQACWKRLCLNTSQNVSQACRSWCDGLAASGCRCRCRDPSASGPAASRQRWCRMVALVKASALPPGVDAYEQHHRSRQIHCCPPQQSKVHHISVSRLKISICAVIKA